MLFTPFSFLFFKSQYKKVSFPISLYGLIPTFLFYSFTDIMKNPRKRMIRIDSEPLILGEQKMLNIYFHLIMSLRWIKQQQTQEVYMHVIV